MEFKIEPEVTKELILQRLSQEQIMEYYLGIPVKKGLFRSPLRNDKNPTCSFYVNGQGDLIFKDFSGSFYGTCFNVVMTKYNCSYHKALEIVAKDFGIISGNHKAKEFKPSGYKLKNTGPTIIQSEIQEFSDKELNWWGNYGITKETLEKFYVYSCKYIFLNGKLIKGSSNNKPIYGYYFGKKDNRELWKIYFPMQREYRFLSNISRDTIQGLLQLPSKGDLLVITKSLKDVMCLYELGITAIAPNSENLFVSKELFESLKNRFKQIVVFYDNDNAGISNMIRIRKEFNCLCLFIPRRYNAKDISDFYKLYGKQKTIELIDEAKKRISNSL